MDTINPESQNKATIEPSKTSLMKKKNVKIISLMLSVMFYEGYSGSSWNLVIKCSNTVILLSCFDISQVDIIELASRS